MEHLTLRPLASAVQWRGFHAANASAFVKERDPAQIDLAAAAGKLFVLVDDQDVIRGGCGIFEYGDGTFREAGGVRITSIVNGWGLQAIVMAVATLSEWTFDPPAVPVAAITATDNAASRRSILRAGFAEVAATDFGSDRFAAMAAKPDPAKVYFTFPDTAVPIAREAIRRVVADGGVAKQAGVLRLTLDVPIVRDGLL